MLGKLRKSKGISLSFVAEKLDVSRDTVRKLECGQTELKVDWLPTLCFLYGITKEELINKYLDERSCAYVKCGKETIGTDE